MVTTQSKESGKTRALESLFTIGKGSLNDSIIEMNAGNTSRNTKGRTHRLRRIVRVQSKVGIANPGEHVEEAREVSTSDVSRVLGRNEMNVDDPVRDLLSYFDNRIHCISLEELKWIVIYVPRNLRWCNLEALDKRALLEMQIAYIRIVNTLYEGKIKVEASLHHHMRQSTLKLCNNCSTVRGASTLEEMKAMMAALEAQWNEDMKMQQKLLVEKARVDEQLQMAKDAVAVIQKILESNG